MIKNSISLFALAVASVAAAPAFAAPAAAPVTDPALQTVEQGPPAPTGDVTPAATTAPDDIVVLGTRRTDRSATNSASPVDIITSAELNAQPAANMLDQVKNIVPSFYVGQNTISDASTFVRSPSLRGLPGDEVLVQINGKRFNRSALVQVYGGSDSGLSFGSQGADISSIPSIAIRNLQVLRDGATAQYGSDAIAGVLNYGLKEKTGLELTGRYGQYYQNGDGKSKQIAGDVGVGIGDIGFVNVAGEYDDDGQTSRGATRPAAANIAALYPAIASQIPNYPSLPAQIWGSSPSHGYKFIVNSAIDVTDSSKLYFFGNFARSRAVESFNYRPSYTTTAVDTAGVTHTLGANGAFNNIYLTPCPAATPTCPAGGYVTNGTVFNFRSIYPAGFTPQFVGVTKELYGTLGYKGDFKNGLHYDLSGSLSRNTLDLSMYESLSQSYGPLSQTSFNFGPITQEEADANLDLSYPLEVGLASPITISGGGEFRKETYKLVAGDPQSYGAGPYALGVPLYTMTAPGVYTAAGTSSGQSPGASGYGGTSPAAAGSWSQTSVAAYVDIEADITKALSVGLAGRYEHYDTFGGKFVGKFNAIYKIGDGFSIRGTIGNGFHAPSPGQSHDSILTTTFINNNQVQVGTYPVDTAISKFYGAVPLTPETSTNYGLGFVAKPLRAVTLTVDGYRIDVDNRIGISQSFTVTAANLAAQPALAAVGVGGAVSYFTNGFNTRTQGVDVVGTYHTALSGALLNFTLAYNYNKSTVRSFNAGTISAAQIIDVEHLAPNHRAIFTTNWQYGDLGINLRENFYSWWSSAVDYGTGSQHFGAKFTTDLDVSYTFAKAYTLTVGGTNILDERPDKLNTQSTTLYPLTDSTSDGQIYPRNGGPFGFNGGFWYVKVRVKY
jgi:iron complex outermembrane receptor protein